MNEHFYGSSVWLQQYVLVMVRVIIYNFMTQDAGPFRFEAVPHLYGRLSDSERNILVKATLYR